MRISQLREYFLVGEILRVVINCKEEQEKSFDHSKNNLNVSVLKLLYF